MKALLARVEAQHEKLIAALDANDLERIEASGRALEQALAQVKASDGATPTPELRQAAERIGRLGQAAQIRVNVLQDQARRRLDAVAALRGRPAPALYSR